MNIIRSKKQQAGLGLVEVIATLAITATITGLGVPAMTQLKERQQLRALAETVMTDLKEARGEAVQGNHGVQFRIDTRKTGSCYVIYTGKDKECSCDDLGAPVCTGSGQALKTHWIAKERGITLRMNASHMGFNGSQGTISPTASIDIVGRNGDGIRHIVAITGRVRSCATGGDIGGLPRCAARA